MSDNGLTPGSIRANEQANAARLQHRRLRAPAEHGESLELPKLADVESLWRENIRRKADQTTAVFGQPLDQLRQQARTELVSLALEYTRQYRDVDLAGREKKSIVMSGHQPELFHPGVWFKNFALSGIGQRVNAVPINLVVDNDLCSNASIKFPRIKNGKASIGLLPIDAPAASVPFEMRSIADRGLFDSFAERVAAEFSQTVPNTIAQTLWKHVQQAATDLAVPNRLGASVAAGRHRLEQDAGLQTLEVPVSRLAETQSFGEFAAAIVLTQATFNQSYNQRLDEYRQVHKIRSSAHPVPQLQSESDWLEAPFWVWSDTDLVRKPLFVRTAGEHTELTDRAGWRWRVGSNDLPNAWGSWAADGVKIRPRALTTTMFCRLVLSDLFLHGIGGANYDQLTDVIARDFFGVHLPGFSTLTATLHLPIDHETTTKSDLVDSKQKLRELNFHPERFIKNPAGKVAAIIDRKGNAIALDRDNAGSERHKAIRNCNESLWPCVADQRSQLLDLVSQIPEKIRNSQILGSREYSYCLFPPSLIEALKSKTALT